MVRDLFDQWERDPPQVVQVARIEKMIERKLGFKWKSGETYLTGDRLVNRLRGMGWL